MASKRNNFDWNIELTKILITLYEENECLYNNLDPDYKNRDKRLSIMARIAKLITDTTGRVCLVADVRKKINSLRSQYLAEKLKITKCKSGSGGDYIPTVYWFPMLRFLDISSEADASQSNLDSQPSQAESDDTMDSQQSHEQETARSRKTKKRNSASTQEDDADGLIKEATATMRQMSQQITSNTNNNSKNHITTFCDFVNTELTSILQASNNSFVKKAKRKIQMCLFDIWDEIDIGNLYEERPSTRTSNFSEDPIVSQNIPAETNTYGELPCTSVPPTSKTVVAGTASSLLVRRNVKPAETNTYGELPCTSVPPTSKTVVTGTASSLLVRRNVKPAETNTFGELPCTSVPPTSKSVETGTASSLLVRKNVLLADIKSKQIKRENLNPQYEVNSNTQESSEDIVFYVSNYDPEEIDSEEIVIHTESN